jgi:hypothetical protein
MTLRAIGATIALTLLTACDGTGGGISSGPFASPASAGGAPPACAGQKKTKTYALDKEPMSPGHGALCIPAFGGFGGTLKYPAVKRQVETFVISSTTNYAGYPLLGNGTPIFYLQLVLARKTAFGAKIAAGGGLASAEIQPGETYTAFPEELVAGFWQAFEQCYAAATKGKYGGTIAGIGSLLAGRTFDGTSIYIEIYPGRQGGRPC